MPNEWGLQAAVRVLVVRVRTSGAAFALRGLGRGQWNWFAIATAVVMQRLQTEKVVLMRKQLEAFAFVAMGIVVLAGTVVAVTFS
jgi:hypothetical protein